MEHPHLGAVVALMMASPRHREYLIADVERLVLPPLEFRQTVQIWEHGSLVAFASYALLSEEAEKGFVSGERKLQGSDWTSGDRLWVMDVIAPYGHARAVCGELRMTLRERGFAGQPIRLRRYREDAPRRYAQVIL